MTTAPIFPLRATYRLQLHEGFGLDAAADCASHIAALGVSHLYLSPVFEARAGSTHGYDVTDPMHVRSAIGGGGGFERLVSVARRHGLGILLDIVPNHMAATEENDWLRDVLAFGDRSPFYAHFDFSWRADPGDPRITLPVLGRPLEDAVEAGEIGVAFDAWGFVFTYYARRFPIRPRDYAELLAESVAGTTQADAGMSAGLPVLVERFRVLRAEDERSARDVLLERVQTSSSLRALLQDGAAAFAADGRTSSGDHRRTRLLRMLRRQHYRLTYWKDVDRLLAYRRFFDITNLIGVRVEEDRVFADMHARVLQWVGAGVVAGVRVDHVDGLLDPTGYLLRLRSECSLAAPERPVPILVEKILAHDEHLPATWPVDGTTGYEFLNAVNGLFVAEPGLAHITQAYRTETANDVAFADVVYAKKKYVLTELFAGEWRVLARALGDLCGGGEDVAAAQTALREITACLPVYRTYMRAGEPVSSEDATRIRAAVQDALRRRSAAPAALERVAQLLCGDATAAASEGVLDFVLHWQQLTGPVMAKGLEDTALYAFHPLASANDVGGAPDLAVRSPEALHDFLAERAAHMPDALNATSTHDTKRAEDVRARINVLSEFPDEWLERWRRWRSRNDSCRERDDAPTANEEYLLYQSVIGAWPQDEPARRDFVARIQGYMQKALREAKASTSWLAPLHEHERAVATFVERILDFEGNSWFVRDVDEFVAVIAPFGVRNALAQLAIKAWAPGVPDFYQGSDGWAFDLVDPDNRRPVDFTVRAAALSAVEAQLREPRSNTARSWLASWPDGRIKMLITAAALRERKAAASLFALGSYQPLRFEGTGSPHLFGFAREHDGEWRILVVTRLQAGCTEALRHGDSALVLPAAAPRGWRNLLTGVGSRAEHDALDAAAVLGGLPTALLAPQ